MIRSVTLFLLSSSLALAALPAAAQSLPGQYNVSGVSAADVLNIRQTPSARAAIIGTLQPDARLVEVLRFSENGRWGLVSAGDSSGWVALRYMKREEPGDPGVIPRPLRCSGTEPFWSLIMDQKGGAEWSTPEEPASALVTVGEGVNKTGYVATFTLGEDRGFDLVATREICSDGMSDREYGFSARLDLAGGEGGSLTGCCTLDGR